MKKYDIIRKKIYKHDTNIQIMRSKNDQTFLKLVCHANKSIQPWEAHLISLTANKAIGTWITYLISLNSNSLLVDMAICIFIL